MKKLFRLLLLIICTLSFIGCIESSDGDRDFIKKPENLKLDIKGEWKLSAYNILDENIATDEIVYEVLDNNILINRSSINIAGKYYNDVDYKIKYVKADYSLSYEANITIEDLDINSATIEVYSVTYDNNLLCEVIKKSTDRAYIYYQGVLFDMIYNKDINEVDNSYVAKEKVDNKYSDDFNSSQGILLGLKSKENGKDETYRTLWISVKSGELQKIRQQEKIFFPRKSGFWVLKDNKVVINDKNIDYEYFLASEVDAETNINQENINILSEGKIIKKEINYVTDDYVIMEIESNEKFSDSPVYKVLPIDNILSQEGIELSELFSYNVDDSFKTSFETAYLTADSGNKSKLNKAINYSNYTLKRCNGMWNLYGRISPKIYGGEPVDFVLKMRPSKSLVKYDTLVIPWKVLKGEIPLLVDAFTSPDGTIAIIVTNSEIKGYRIVNGSLAKEILFSIELKENEQVIMAEWCENQYIDKWEVAFKDNSIIIE